MAQKHYRCSNRGHTSNTEEESPGEEANSKRTRKNEETERKKLLEERKERTEGVSTM